MKLFANHIKTIALFFLMTLGLSANAAIPKRIITLSGALTETVDALGFGKSIVAVDVTSIYPAYITSLPKVSKNRTVSAEGLISFKPDLVLAPEGSVSKEIAYQLQSAGINLVNIKQDYSVSGSIAFIKAVAAALQVPAKGEALAKQTQAKVDKALAAVKQSTRTPKVLFIYARGTGVMLVAGQHTNIDAIIALAGGKNAAQGFDNFKPYTTESLIEANPDVILMFDFGLSSLGGADAVLKMPGVAQTNAGKNKKIVQMDGELLINFSVRLDQAIATLNKNLQ
ncbi:hemin ABC transporter substrate-binding protein [Mucilaginibacter rubeus]|uniref:ABC transporter substrate-binding protein n=1 Tax=Mucilaginibacter rubeus TaxID=2027860 RepID=A0A5C1HXP4_9SPHI|nr:ABC transporter substrate-binding protein [Mucilaginibacter rubeus]QEM10677.1 ABC transporter substrate-binding protein [Mucilaginibacter rubeus]